MAYRLAPSLSFCMLGGEPYFLDLDRDRYFRLTGKLRSAFIALVANAESPQPEIESLVERRLLERTIGAAAISPTFAEIPTRSVIEDSRLTDTGGLRFAPEVAARLAGVRLERRLVCLAESIRRRRKMAPGLHGEVGACRLALQYEAARRMFPARPRCLPDSLALFDFLTARKERVQIVFGIRREPFAAHCWVQTGRSLLNETADIAAGFQPICIVP